jgi:intraflagellar transport protein 80
VRSFDLRNARQLGAQPYVHSTTVQQIALSQGPMGGLQERKLAILDSSHDLFLTTLLRPSPLKIQTMTDSIAFGDTSDTLVALADGNMVSWIYPQAFFLDADLAHAAKVTAEASVAASFGLLPQILSFTGGRVAVRRGDGAVLHATVATFPPLLYECVQAGKWENAVRLCRFVKQQPLWAAAAAMAINGRHLDTAEVALAACGYVDKLQFIVHVKEQVSNALHCNCKVHISITAHTLFFNPSLPPCADHA